VKIERELAGNIVRDDGAVNVYGALRLASRAAGKVQKRGIAGRGGSYGEGGVSILH
jgi:hypothetical protein